MIYALDTNIVSYCLKGLFNLEEKIDDTLAEGNHITIPPITFYESLRGLLAVKATTKLMMFHMMYSQLGQSKMEEPDWVRAAKLYADLKQKGRPMSDSDILQAAFCLRRGYTLVTHNIKHYDHIEELDVIDWV
jgi:predicted nucleic acid-binding protein